VPTENLARTILANAATYGDRTALQTEGGAVSYPVLRDVIVNYALHMRAGGIGRGACVAIDSNHPLITVIVSIACSLLGCSWVHFTPFVRRNPALRVTHFIHDGANHATERRNVLRVTPAWSAPPPGQVGRDANGFPGFANSDATWMIAQSSGTTGDAKFMAISERIAQRRLEIVWPFDPPAQARFAPLFHPLSVPAIYSILRILLDGGTCCFGRNWETLVDWGVDFVRAAPNHYLALTDRTPDPQAKIPVCLCTGGPAGRPFIERLGRYFDTVIYMFSSSETANVCANVITDTRNLPAEVSVGPVRAQARVQIVSETGGILAPGHEGIVRVRSECQVPGYIGAPEDTARAFRDGWFHPGDLGYLSAAGELFITGRVGDQLNVGGVKINPLVIEGVMQAYPGVRESVCLAYPDARGVDRLVAALVVAEGEPPAQVARGLRHKLEQSFGPSRTPREFYLVDAIAKNPNGKVVRREMVDVVRTRQPITL